MKKCNFCEATTNKSFFNAGWRAVRLQKSGEKSRWCRACPKHFKEFKTWYEKELEK